MKMVTNQKSQSLSTSATLHPAIQNVAAVIFDVGGTLVHPDWRRVGEFVEAETGRTFTPVEMYEAFYAMLQAATSETYHGVTSKFPAEAHWTFVNTLRKLGIDDADCRKIREHLVTTHRERHLWCDPDPEAAGVLSQLKNAGKRIAVISNTEDGRVSDSLSLAELDGHFEFVIDSHLVGCSKPEPTIFQIALDRLRLDASQAAYVGDSYAYDVVGAQRAGIHPIFLDRSDSYEGAPVTRIRSLRELILAV